MTPAEKFATETGARVMLDHIHSPWPVMRTAIEAAVMHGIAWGYAQRAEERPAGVAVDLAALSGFESGRADAAIEIERLKAELAKWVGLAAQVGASGTASVIAAMDEQGRSVAYATSASQWALGIERWREILRLRAEVEELKAERGRQANAYLGMVNAQAHAEADEQHQRGQVAFLRHDAEKLRALLARCVPAVLELHEQGYGCPGCRPDGHRHRCGYPTGCEEGCTFEGVTDCSLVDDLKALEPSRSERAEQALADESQAAGDYFGAAAQADGGGA